MSIQRVQAAGDLEESLAALSVLEENLKKTDELTVKMSNLLSTVFDARLGKLEETIKPMYNTTRNLTHIAQSIYFRFWDLC
jgi:exocyst complex component 7